MGGGASFSFDIPMFETGGRPSRGATGGYGGGYGGGGYGGGGYGGRFHDDISGDDGDSDEEGCHFSAYDHARPRRRPARQRSLSPDRPVFSQEDYEKNLAAENALVRYANMHVCLKRHRGARLDLHRRRESHACCCHGYFLSS